MRRLPNRTNHYNGHGQTIATPIISEAPKTVLRERLSTGETSLITESEAYAELCCFFDAATKGTPLSEALTEILLDGGRLATPLAIYQSADAANDEHAWLDPDDDGLVWGGSGRW